MAYIAWMPLGTALRFRLDAASQRRLKRVAEKSGVSVSLLVRQAVEEFCRTAERTGKLPIRLDEERGSYGKAPKEDL